MADPIARLVSDWQAQLPGLDTSAMATFARMNRLVLLLRRRIEDRMNSHGLTTGEFDVLSALRRQGAPYTLKPSTLARTTMLSPSGMTNRIHRLEHAGLVKRVPDPASRRTLPVALTDHGLEVVEGLVHELVAVENEAFDLLTADDRRQLDVINQRLLDGLREGER